MANQNQNDNKKNFSFYISGIAGWNNMTDPVINDYKNYQYSLRIENPVFINPSNDPETEQMIQMIKNSPKIKQPNAQYPNQSIVLSLPANKMDGTPQKPRYFDKATGAEVLVKKNIGTGQPVTVVAGAQLSNNSKYGFAIYLNGVIFDNVETAKWYEQTAGNPLLAGFTPLSAQETMNTPAKSETNVMFDQGSNNLPAGQNSMNNTMPTNNGMTNQTPNGNMNNGMGAMQNMQPTQPTQPIQPIAPANNNGAANNIPAGQNSMNNAMPTNNGMTNQMPNGNMNNGMGAMPTNNGMTNQMPNGNTNNGMGAMQNMQPTQPIAPVANGLNNPSAAWNQGQSQSTEVPFPEQNTNNDPTPNTNSAQDYFNHNA